MDVRFYWYLLFKEKSIVVQWKVKDVKEKPILLQEKNHPIFIFDQTRDEDNLTMDEDYP